MTNPTGGLGGEIGGYIQLATILATALGAGVDQVKVLVRKIQAELHPGMTEAQVNEILQAVASDADRRRLLAEADAADATKGP